MLSRYLKNTLFFSAVAIAVFAVFVSCENPFSNNLGRKVDIEPPTITLGDPSVGSYLKGVVHFSGTVNAYRELRRVEVKIFNQEDDSLPPLHDGTHPELKMTGDDPKQKTWTFDLNTLDFNGQILDDGFLKIQFRVYDSNRTSNMGKTAELVYIIKNNPSIVKMTAPDSSKLEGDIEPPRLGTNTEVRGQIIDRRGIKPGYPRIKIWPEEWPEPAGDDPEWGWAVLFLSGVDTTDDEAKNWSYKDRNSQTVERAANFVFRLSKFTIDPDTRQIRYDLSSGDFEPLETGVYRFRIQTSDTFFDDDPASDTFMFPREPEGDEVEAVGWHPVLRDTDTEPLDRGPFYSLQVVSSGEPPEIELDNSDKTPAELDRHPNIYINAPTAMKINEFRLRILAAHSDGIANATLSWSHGAGLARRSGNLNWDNGSAGDFTGIGNVFVYTGDNSKEYDDGTVTNRKIFTSSSDPYTLEVRAYSVSGIVGVANYLLYIDGAGPEATIRSMIGQAEDPAGGNTGSAGAWINNDPYIVNGNIQVSVDRGALLGIRASEDDNIPVVKWIVQEAPPNAADNSNIISKLETFRANPTADNLQFFNDIGETPISGWVRPETTHNFKFNAWKDSGGPLLKNSNEWDGEDLWLYIIAQDKVYNLGYIVQKLSVDDSTDIPGMVVAGGDFKNDGIITGKDDLLITYDNLTGAPTGGNTTKQNILDSDQGIELTFTDDDGISMNKGGVEITLKDLNSGKEVYLKQDENLALLKKALNGKDYLESGSSLELSGTLTQAIMAEAMYEGQDPLPKNLYDGFYVLTIKITDNIDVKVGISRYPQSSRPGDVPTVVSKEETFYFAVQSQAPVIDVIGIENNSSRNKEAIEVKGTVKSRLEITKLEITFSPGMDSGAWPSVSSTGVVTTSSLQTWGATPTLTMVRRLDLDEDNYWVYDWAVPAAVNFGNDLVFASGATVFEWRTFNLVAYDSLGTHGIADRTIQVDSTPPAVELSESFFNFGRLPNEEDQYILNGKVPIVIMATDLNGIADDGVNANVWWWILPSAASRPTATMAPDGTITVTPYPFPGGGAAGLGGRFKTTDNKGGGNYQFILNTTNLADNATYNLWAIAQDKAGNFSVLTAGTPPLRTFTVNQNSDLPVLVEGSLKPDDGAVISGETTSLVIEGKAFDDDGFDKDKLGTYIQIRFASGTNNAWGNWIPINSGLSGAALSGPDAMGEIRFVLNLQTNNFSGYFATDGEKRYQILITDEAVAAVNLNPSNPLKFADPPGKNPDGNLTLGPVQRQFPTSGYYSFYLKKELPEVYFTRNDVKPGHDGYTSQRPVYGTSAELLADLNDLYVVDGYLESVKFTYNTPGTYTGTTVKDQELITVNPNNVPVGNRYDKNYAGGWHLVSAWLAPFSHSSMPDGMQSIAIEAIDQVGQKTRVEYTFYKDTSPPLITFTNMSTGIISGEASAVAVRGNFRDEYSNIANTFTYQFDKGLPNSGLINTVNTFGDSGTPDKTANWEIKIPNDPGFPDGEHSLTITVADSYGNTREEFVVFLVDRAPPELSKEAAFVVTAGSGSKQLVMADAYTRVFSASGYTTGDTNPAFFLSGLVYEHNLTSLSVGIYANSNDTNAEVSEKLDQIDQNDFDVVPEYDKGGNLSLKKAIIEDGGLYGNIGAMPANANNVYVWTLKVTKGDLAALLVSDSSEAVRRQIVVVATDLAGKNSSRESWRFSLDGTPPDVKYYNLNETAASTLMNQTISLQGMVEDFTNVKEIRYRIARWNYAGTNSGWQYYNGTTWTATPNNNYSSWPNLLAPETIKSSVSWTLDNAALTGYPANLFNTEGKYRLDLYATDYSLNDQLEAAGNALILNETVDAPNGRVFFIDRTLPNITGLTTRKDYYSGADGNIVFQYTVTDANGIKGVSANLSPSAGSVTVTPAAYDPNTLTYAVTVTISGMGGAPSDKYSLTLTATDGAGRAAEDKIEFNLDNTAPTITAPHVPLRTNDTAVTGRVIINGSFSKLTDSPVQMAAFYIGTGSAAPSPAMPTVEQVKAVGSGWHYNTGGGADPWNLVVGGKTLAEIAPGTSSAVITLPNTRDFLTSSPNYLGPMTTITLGIPALTFNGASIPNGEEIYPLTIYYFAVDEAGNREVTPFTYYIYPEGDRPIVDKINSPKQDAPESERMLNGRIRIAGTAVDNVRVKRVWFRVLKAETETYATDIRIPEWNEETWEPAGNQNQTSQELFHNVAGVNTSLGIGWYKANGGGSSSVSWWAYINTEGELDPIFSNSAKITIEVMAEDTTWVDSIPPDGGWDPAMGLYSKKTSESSVYAYVVSGAPRFEDDMVLNPAVNGSSSSLGAGVWGSNVTTYMRGRSAYAVTVKHTQGVGSITWNGYDLLAANPYTTTTYGTHITAMSGGTYNANTNPGIAAKAGPKALITTGLTALDALTAARTFMIWTTSSAAAITDSASTILVPTNDNKRLTTFTLEQGRTVNVSSGGVTELMEMVDGYFEWIVVIDINANILEGGKYLGGAAYHDVELTATETSKVIPLKQEQTLNLPIDNLPPTGMYTHNGFVAGTDATFGGEAGDTGAVNGLSRVVLWFSRMINGTQTSFKWDGDTDAFNGSGTTLPDGSLAGVNVPVIPAESALTGGNDCIVIDRNDPMGQRTHHGHGLRMGFASGGSLGTSWYVTLDSTKMESGRVTAHYIVYDKAGNTKYYTQKLVIMNNVPRINRITLATDIRGDTGLGATLGAGNGRYVAMPGGGVTADGTPHMGAAPVSQIRTAVQGKLGLTAADPDTDKGISMAIPINTERLNAYGVVYDEAFTVRNNLLAVKVDLIDTVDENLKTWSKTKRTFRVEYVSGAVPITYNAGTRLLNVRAGRIYIINDPGANFPWGSYGLRVAEGDTARRGMAFMAVEDGANVTIQAGAYGTPSAWELNGSYYQTPADPFARTHPGTLGLPDVALKGGTPGNTTGAYSAEFMYGSNAFGTAAGTRITDFAPAFAPDDRPLPYPLAGVNPWVAHSLFIVKVFDGDEEELFGDFALLSIRVNNDDKTRPYAQLYDLNPKTEGQDTNVTQTAALQMNMGGNRIKGGLYNNGTVQVVEKSGHIEPRKNSIGGTNYVHTLTSGQMGGAATATAATMQKPLVDDAAIASFLNIDTVSGKVILRGYAEDDQRIHRIDLEFYNAANTGNRTDFVTILEFNNNTTANPAPFLRKGAALRGGDVEFTETVDLNRHRVEWAYLWDTEQLPATTLGGATGTVVGDITVRAVAYNANNATPKGSKDSNTHISHAYGTPATYTQANYNGVWDYYNPDFPLYDSRFALGGDNHYKFRRYNSMRINLRPYITGFKRNKNDFAHDTRSRQGRYMFAQSEVAVISGFNLGASGVTPTIGLPTANAGTYTNAINVGNITATAANNPYEVDMAAVSASRYRQFTVPAGAVTGNGKVAFTVSGYMAVNTGTERLAANSVRPVIQPWNTERSPGIAGSQLWDDFTMLHIWQSDDTHNTGTDRGRFDKTTNMIVKDPAMTINPANGTLYSSHSQAGGNQGGIDYSTNAATGMTRVAQFCDPIITSDIFISTNLTTVWTAHSIIGEQGGGTGWASKGGIFISGPRGGNAGLTSGLAATTNSDTVFNSQYLAESCSYNANANAPGTQSNPPALNQFLNPHIITYYDGTNEHIHVSYYDDKDGSMKYRYNRRGSPGTITGSAAGTATTAANSTAPYAWTNLDGGYDVDDQNAYNAANNTNWATGAGGGNRPANDFIGAIATNGRIVNWNTRTQTQGRGYNIDAGKHNAIALNRNGYPVIAYYDETNGKLKLAVSNGTTMPVAAASWKIRDNVIPRDNLNYNGTGQYVSMMIDTRGANDIIHIAALNSLNRNMVYIRGELYPVRGTSSQDDTTAAANNVLINVTVQVVDSVGSVGSWCKLSLDSQGNPWIAYKDESFRGSRDGVKVAYLDSAVFYKGGTSYFTGKDIDVWGQPITGWEAMNVPTYGRVEDASATVNTRLGMECYPARNYAGTPNPTTKFWAGAVGYLAPDYYRIAYYVK
ncbi:MAG: hypothetical protein LBH20_07580 [Treponema sp.]|jgi:hypothetical protein|nr:hypothetical protein [Treponema sp.]